MFGYTLIIEEVWSNNIFLPKSSSIKYLSGNNRYYILGKSNNFENYTYRLKLSIVKTKHIKQ